MKKIVFVCFCLFFISCSSGPHTYKDEFIAIGTYLEVISADREASKIVHQEVKRLEKIFNNYDPESEISRLNNTYNTQVSASSEMIEVLLLAKEIYDFTYGAFDISCGCLYEYWKEIIDRNKPVYGIGKETLRSLKGSCGINDVYINKENKTVMIKKRGLKIDLGGIAKGYIVDKCIGALKKEGIENALINAGGDLYCLGESNYHEWRVGLKLPGQSQAIAGAYELKNQAMATSGDYEQFFELDGKRYSHIIDPRSGRPAEGKNMSVSVVAKTTALADSLATAFYILPKEQIQNVIDEHDLEVKVFILDVDEQGKVARSEYGKSS
jgi:FAD:protein FMN transferase